MATITRTDRLILMPLNEKHDEEAYKVYSDKRIWTHRPHARHEDVRETHQLIGRTQVWADIRRDGRVVHGLGLDELRAVRSA